MYRKKKIIIILMIFLLSSFIFSFKKAQAYEITDEQKKVKALMNAYYRKGSNIQYGPPKKTFCNSPEQATSQNKIYFNCNNYVFSVYYQAFDMVTPTKSAKIMSYAYDYYDSNKTKTNDVSEFWIRKEPGKYVDNKGKSKNIDLSTTEGRNKYGLSLLKSGKLREGDVLCGFAKSSSDGGFNHVLIVYKIVYDNNGNPIDAIIREGAGNGWDKSIKTGETDKYGVFDSIYNKNTKIKEGCIKESYLLRNYNYDSGKSREPVMKKYIAKLKYFTIYRPILLDKNGNSTGKYYYTEFADDTNVYGTKCKKRVLKDLSSKKDTDNRIRYSGIDIEKTVDQSNYKTVDLNTSLEYTIKVTNTSGATYKNFDIIENISEYVEVEDKGGGTQNGSKLTWTIKNLAGGQSKEIKYKVKVKSDENIYGKTITSIGTVAGINSATITNFVGKKLSNEDCQKIKNKTQELFDKKELKKGDLINAIYKEALGIDLHIDSFNIDDLVKEDTNRILYYPPTSKGDSMWLNQNSEFYGMSLKKYYGGVRTTNKDGKITYTSRRWENEAPVLNSRSERIDTIYNKNFMTGDILIFKNVQNPKSGETFPKENGTFYMIYISKSNKITALGKELYGFIGVTSNGGLKKIDTYTYSEAQQILAKDKYVILRPAQTINLEKEIINNNTDEEELVGTGNTENGEVAQETVQNNGIEDVEVKDSRKAKTTSQQSQEETTDKNAQEETSNGNNANVDNVDETQNNNSTDNKNSNETNSNNNNTDNKNSNGTTNKEKNNGAGTQSNPGVSASSPKSYELVIESNVGMQKILIYKKTAENKYILFKKVMPEGAKKYTVKILKSLLNSSGKTEFKAVVTEIDGNREVVNASIPR